MARQDNTMLVVALVAVVGLVCFIALGIGLYFWMHTQSTPAIEQGATASLLSASEANSSCPAFNTWAQTTLPNLLQNSMTMTAAEYNQQLLSDLYAVTQACPNGTYYNVSDPSVLVKISTLYSLAATQIPAHPGRRFYPLMGFKPSDVTSTCPAFNTWMAAQPLSKTVSNKQRLASFNAANIVNTCPLTTPITNPAGETVTLGAFQQSLINAAAATR